MSARERDGEKERKGAGGREREVGRQGGREKESAPACLELVHATLPHVQTSGISNWSFSRSPSAAARMDVAASIPNM